METFDKAVKLSGFLERFAENLDIPETRYLEAKKRYEAVGEWLGKEDSPLSEYAPKIYAQGSFALGTVIKPISNRDEYDIDLVCDLSNLSKQKTSQRELKKMVGDRLQENDTYSRLLDEEGRRCWTLNYANEFHMDVLPAIPDVLLRTKGGFYDGAILITDKESIKNGDVDWPKSNPLGYAKWFRSREETIFLSMRNKLAKSIGARVDDVPEYRVKTPLQRVIQILKRHRDIYFSGKESSNKPISIIITTLSAKLYMGQDNIYNAIHDILFGLDENAIKLSGRFYVQNPVNSEENFADKWNEDISLSHAFFEWVNTARSTFGSSLLDSIDTKDQSLEKSLGISIGSNQSGNNKSLNIGPAYVKVNPSQERRPWGSACV